MATPKTAHQICSIQDFVKQLRQLPERTFQEIEELRSFLAHNPVDPDTLTPYICWDSQHYTRTLIDKTRLYELLAICWEVGQVSSIHNHRGQNCWMAVPIGRLMVQNYRVLFQDLEGGRCKLERTFAVEMNAASPVAVNPKEPVHKVYNPKEFGERAVSLHIYSHPFDSCDVYSEEQQTCGTIKLSYTTEYGKRRAASGV
ncbi:MAG TPA: cysteine dioxygenase family protein [Terriglobales bacterium]|nr:cysteine dioxygenase family protein [Terriglobales bacterium]